MSDISQIKLLDGTVYDIKDAKAGKTYLITGQSDTTETSYIKLGTLVCNAADGVIIDCLVGNGYNGSTNQNIRVTGYLHFGNLTILSSAVGTVVETSNTNCTLIVMASSVSTCDVYLYVPYSYNKGNYTIYGRYASWTHSDTSGTEPTETESYVSQGVKTVFKGYSSYEVTDENLIITLNNSI